MLDDGEIERRVRLIRPMEHHSLPLKMMAESHWAEADRECFAAAWQAELGEVPEFTDSTIHVVAGLLLPIWNGCRTSRPASTGFRPMPASASSAARSRRPGWRLRWLAARAPTPDGLRRAAEVRTVFGACQRPKTWRRAMGDVASNCLTSNSAGLSPCPGSGGDYLLEAAHVRAILASGVGVLTKVLELSGEADYMKGAA
jgi:hypothetical protein